MAEVVQPQQILKKEGIVQWQGSHDLKNRDLIKPGGK